MTIAERILRFVEEMGLYRDPPGNQAAPLIACSGGPDSTVLSHALLRLWQAERIPRPTLVYVDHRLRPESSADGVKVAELAKAFGVEFVHWPVTVDRTAASLENSAREARYRALDELSAARGGVPVFLGHTATDQAETVLMRLIRGTGLRGLAGMPAQRGPYVRPLLGTSRQEIFAYLDEFALDSVTDPMNADPRFFRSRIRHQVLPMLRAENPAVDAALIRVATAAAEVEDALSFAAEAALAAAAIDPSTLDVSAFRDVSPTVLKHAFSWLAECAGLRPLESAHLDALFALAKDPSQGTRTLSLPGGTAIRQYERLSFATAAPAAVAPPLCGVTVTGEGGPYEVRTWRAGDRMRPARLRGRSRKLSDLFTDARVPRHSRENARVVVRVPDGAIVWAEHLGLAADARVQVSLTP
jgi:tRNA(Ile)-lysidine synthase